MNTALSLLGISQLEAAKKVEKGKGYIELNNGELVTIKDLCDFWIEGHKKLFDATKIVKIAKELVKKNERSTEEEGKVSSEQKVETVCTSSISKTKRTRRNNKVKTEKV